MANSKAGTALRSIVHPWRSFSLPYSRLGTSPWNIQKYRGGIIPSSCRKRENGHIVRERSAPPRKQEDVNHDAAIRDQTCHDIIVISLLLVGAADISSMAIVTSLPSGSSPPSLINRPHCL
jgi:hypothetical protein